MRLKRVSGETFRLLDIRTIPDQFSKCLEEKYVYLVSEDGYIYLKDTSEIPQARLKYLEDFDSLEAIEEYDL